MLFCNSLASANLKWYRPGVVGTRHTVRTTKRQRWVRQLTIWVGLICLLSNVTAAAHFLLVEHVYCAEHGEWVHADEEHSHVYATITTETPGHSAEGHAVQSPRQENDHDHAHEHCHACSERRGASAISANERVASFDLETKNTGVMGSEAPALLRPVHKTAPKASAPA